MAEKSRQQELEVAGWPNSILSQETERDKCNGSAPHTAWFYTVHSTLLRKWCKAWTSPISSYNQDNLPQHAQWLVS